MKFLWLSIILFLFWNSINNHLLLLLREEKCTYILLWWCLRIWPLPPPSFYQQLEFDRTLLGLRLLTMYSIQLDEELSGGGIINHVSGMRFIQAGQHTQLALSLTIKFLSSGFKLSFKAAAIALSLVRKKVIQWFL